MKSEIFSHCERNSALNVGDKSKWRRLLDVLSYSIASGIPVTLGDLLSSNFGMLDKMERKFPNFCFWWKISWKVGIISWVVKDYFIIINSSFSFALGDHCIYFRNYYTSFSTLQFDSFFKMRLPWNRVVNFILVTIKVKSNNIFVSEMSRQIRKQHTFDTWHGHVLCQCFSSK